MNCNIHIINFNGLLRVLTWLKMVYIHITVVIVRLIKVLDNIRFNHIKCIFVFKQGIWHVRKIYFFWIPLKSWYLCWEIILQCFPSMRRKIVKIALKGHGPKDFSGSFSVEWKTFTSVPWLLEPGWFGFEFWLSQLFILCLYADLLIYLFTCPQFWHLTLGARIEGVYSKGNSVFDTVQYTSVLLESS